MIKLGIVLSTLIILPTTTMAYDKVEKMNVTNVGISSNSNTFVVYVDRDVPGSICNETKRFKFYLDDPTTNITVSLITTAFVADKPVQFQYNLGNDECISNGQSAGFVKLFHN